MEHDELLKLIGEQTLLQKERLELSAAFARDKDGLLRLVNALTLGKSGWIDAEQARLVRLAAAPARLAEIAARIDVLQKLTGI
jgi:hypothetical protein